MNAALRANDRRKAATVVEVTVVAAVVLMILFGVFEYGRFIMTRQLMENAAAEGARYAVVHTYDKSTLDVQNLSFDTMSGQEKQLESFSKTSDIQVYLAGASGGPVNAGQAWNHSSNNWKDAQFGELIGVRITGNYKPILPTFLFIVVDSNGMIPIQVTAVMYSEAN